MGTKAIPAVVGLLLAFAAVSLIQAHETVHWMSIEKNENSPSKATKYEPNWNSLDARPIPQWYDDAKIGIFLHWGVFSVPSYVGAWFWYLWKGPKPLPSVVEFMALNYKPGFTYADFAPQFTAEFYDPNQWADIFKASGAQYVVLTTKHHEGFCNWDTKYSWNWNAMDVGPKRDLVGDLATALRAKGLRFGAYHSLFEFFNPLFLQDQANNFTTQDFVIEKTMPELYEIVHKYKPDIIWSDGEWMAPDTYWNSTHFLAWLYNESPIKDFVVTNDRWGMGTMCHHGGYLTCHDKYNPGVIQKRKFEDPTTMDRYAWTYRRDLHLSDVESMEDVITLLVQVVSCGGNLLINVGPTKDGIIVPIFEERLRQMGDWLKVNGEAIYSSKPWINANDTVNPDIWYTSKTTDSTTAVYATLLKWPGDNMVQLGLPVPTSSTQVTLLGYSGTLKWTYSATDKLRITLPIIPINKMPCQWAWVFKLTNLEN